MMISIAFAGPGGVGKTVSSFLSAISLSTIHTKRVLLIDADVSSKMLTRLTGLGNETGLIEYLSHRESANPKKPFLYHKGSLRILEEISLEIIPAGRGRLNIYDYSILFTRFSILLEQLGHDIILVDTPPGVELGSTPFTRAIKDSVDYLIVLTTMEKERVAYVDSIDDDKVLIKLVLGKDIPLDPLLRGSLVDMGRIPVDRLLEMPAFEYFSNLMEQLLPRMKERERVDSIEILLRKTISRNFSEMKRERIVVRVGDLRETLDEEEWKRILSICKPEYFRNTEGEIIIKKGQECVMEELGA